jgi:hypothetical protein
MPDLEGAKCYGGKVVALLAVVVKDGRERACVEGGKQQVGRKRFT